MEENKTVLYLFIFLKKEEVVLVLDYTKVSEMWRWEKIFFFLIF